MSMGDTTITVIGNITADPDLKFSQTGVAVAGFTVAASRRVLDRASGQWADGDTLFLRCSAFRHLAENVAESLTRGTRVVVTGRLKQRSYEDREGVKRTVFEVDVEDVGPSLKWATAKVSKVQRDRPVQPAGNPADQPPAGSDPWDLPASPAAAAASVSGFGGGFSTEPPF